MPKCLLSTVRRYKTSPTDCVSSELPGAPGSGDGSDTSDCSMGTSRPVRNSQRKAVKRKRSLSHLSVVTRFYLHTEQSEGESHQPKDGSVNAASPGAFSSLDCPQSLPAEVVQSFPQAKHAELEAKLRPVKSKQLPLSEEEWTKTPLNIPLKRNKDSGQNAKSPTTTESCDDRRGHTLQPATVKLLEVGHQWPRVVLPYTHLQQKLTLPDVYTDFSQPQQCLAATGSGSTWPVSSLQSSDALFGFSQSATDSALTDIHSIHAAATSSVCLKHSTREGGNTLTTERATANGLTSGLFVGNQLLPVALVQPVLLQSAPTFISSNKIPPASVICESHTVLPQHSAAVVLDCLQNTRSKSLLRGPELCLVSTASSQPPENVVLDQTPVTFTACTSSKCTSWSSQPKSHAARTSQGESSLSTVTKERVVLAKDSSDRTVSRFSSASVHTFSVDDTKRDAASYIHQNDVSAVAAGTVESCPQDHPVNGAKDNATGCSQPCYAQKPSTDELCEEIFIPTPERICCSLNKSYQLLDISVSDADVSVPHEESEMHCDTTATQRIPDSVVSFFVSNMDTADVKLPQSEQSTIDYAQHCEPQSSIRISSPSDVSVPNQLFSALVPDTVSTKETCLSEIQSINSTKKITQDWDLDKGHADTKGIEFGLGKLNNRETIAVSDNLNKGIVAQATEHMKSCITSYQDRNTAELHSHNTDSVGCHSTIGYHENTTFVEGSNASHTDDRSTEQMNSSIYENKNQSSTSSLDRTTRIHCEVNTNMNNESDTKRPVYSENQHQELKMPKTRTEHQGSNIFHRQGTSTGIQPQDRKTLEHPREANYSTYSSKWISVIASCISAQPSSFSVLSSPIPAVLTPMNHLNAFPNTLVFSAGASTDVNRTPLTNLNNLNNVDKSTSTSGSAEHAIVTKNRSTGKKKENKSPYSNAGSLGDILAPFAEKHVGTQAGMYSDVNPDSVLFNSLMARKDDERKSHSFGEVGGLGHGAPSQKCLKCGLKFFTHTDLLFHMTAHEVDRQGTNKEGSQKGNQSDAETGDSRNKCAVCSRVFTRSWLLKGHMRTHTGERPFRCTWPQCQRAFADKSNLRSHTLIHTTTAKSFTCPKCSRAFSQKRYLHKHMLEVCRII